jgi:hypothetical protein
VTERSDLNDQVLLRSDNSGTTTTFSGDIERMLEKKFRDMRELFDLVYSEHQPVEEKVGFAVECLDSPEDLNIMKLSSFQDWNQFGPSACLRVGNRFEAMAIRVGYSHHQREPRI